MPYTHFRAIAYEVPTATSPTGGGGVISGWAPGPLVPAVARLPVPANIANDTNRDAENRLLRLAAAVDRAEARVQLLGGDNANTLKIFIVPEFYFRPPIINANYASNTYPQNVLAGIVGALDQMFAHADFQHWLFICGTVLWNDVRDIGPPIQRLYWNTALWIRGGANRRTTLVEKQLPSGIDGVPVAMAPGMDPQVRLVVQDWRERRKHIFKVEGIPFGIEVCLDHLNADSCRVLKGVRYDWILNEVRNPFDSSVKIHLLTAGGMGIEPNSVAADVNGYILRNDGITNPGARSELRRVDRYKRPGYFSGFWTYDTFQEEADAFAEFTPVASQATLPLPHAPTDVTLAIPPGHKSFTQRLVFYPVTAIPA
jgi:hypothetical protein